MFHDDFFFIEVVVALDRAGRFTTVQVKVIMECDAMLESLAFMLLKLICGALPPEMAVRLIGQCNLALWI